MGKLLNITTLFLAALLLLLISNLVGTKLIAFGPIITDGGAILFPISYILGDVLTEIYGYKYARTSDLGGTRCCAFGSAVLHDRALYATSPRIQLRGVVRSGS